MTTSTIRGAVGALLLVASSVPTTTQAQVTYRACFIPQVGAMYLLDLPGLPTACLSTDHQEITWSENAVLAPGSVATADIADGAIDAAKLADNAVTTAKLAADAVTSAEIADDAVTSAAIAPGAVTATVIAPGAVTATAIAANAVTSTAIAPNAVTPSALANLAVTGSKIAPSSVNSSHISDGSVGSADIADNSIAADDLADNSVGGAALAVQYWRAVTQVTVPSGITVEYNVTCPGTREVVSGGWRSLNRVSALGSWPSATNRWSVRLFHTLGPPQQVTLWAVCADLF